VEIQVEFGRGVRGVLHRPRARRRGRGAPAALLCHGYTGNRVEDGRLFVRMARALAVSGVAALRFDYRGSGDSDGAFEDATLSTEIEDGLAAAAFLRRDGCVDPGRLAAIGLSLGSVVAQAIAVPLDFRALVLWAAVAWPARVFTSDLGAKARGYAASRRFLREIRAFDPLARVRDYAGPLLCVHGEHDFVPLDSARAVIAAAAKGGRLHVVRGADHTFGNARKKGEAVRVTANFLLRVLRR
jgi:dipeptidyl aminopeptidase/acylaminoacyl peptidase